MASILKDPAVVEHVAKQTEKATAAERKRLLKELKAFHGAHAEGLGDDKAAKKYVAEFHKAAQAQLSSPVAA